jgi:hypothetical protein
MRPRPSRKVECPNCGAWFPPGRLACPECGSDAETGWKPGEDIEYEAVDLPEPYGSEESRPRRARSVVVTVAAILLILALLLAALTRF